MTQIENFVSKHLQLIKLEKSAERNEDKHLQDADAIKALQKKGIFVPGLVFVDSNTGLYGRTLITFQYFQNGKDLPAHNITSGDIVGIGDKIFKNKPSILAEPGIVTVVTKSSIEVVFEKNKCPPDLEYDSQYFVIRQTVEGTYNRLESALKKLLQLSGISRMVDVCFGLREPSSVYPSAHKDIKFLNTNLSQTQKEAVTFVLRQNEVAILHGPPGTGKTTTLVECILQTVAQKKKVLVCAPSNIAVDNLVEQLSTMNIMMVRLGHPSRISTSIQSYSLDAVVIKASSDEMKAKMKQFNRLRERILRTKGLSPKKKLWDKCQKLLQEIKKNENIMSSRVLEESDVVLSTLTSASDVGPLKHLEKNHFGVCFIDECSQSTEAACWIPLTNVPKCVLAGDYKQLPPTIISRKAAREGLALTFMERLLQIHGKKIKIMLTWQFRMNELIMRWPSNRLYGGKLRAHDSVKKHLLRDLKGVKNNYNTSQPLILIDTAGCGYDEMTKDGSKGNIGEADMVAIHFENLVNSGVKSTDIGIISPYNLQVELIKSRLSEKYPKVEVNSVDGFQGREKEAVILSLVRSNEKGDVGFLREIRRINVAITRARRHLAVICNSDTASHLHFLKHFISYCYDHGEVRMAHEHKADITQSPPESEMKRIPPMVINSTTAPTAYESKGREFTQKENRNVPVPKTMRFPPQDINTTAAHIAFEDWVESIWEEQRDNALRKIPDPPTSGNKRLPPHITTTVAAARIDDKWMRESIRIPQQTVFNNRFPTDIIPNREPYFSYQQSPSVSEIRQPPSQGIKTTIAQTAYENILKKSIREGYISHDSLHKVQSPPASEIGQRSSQGVNTMIAHTAYKNILRKSIREGYISQDTSCKVQSPPESEIRPLPPKIVYSTSTAHQGNLQIPRPEEKRENDSSNKISRINRSGRKDESRSATTGGSFSTIFKNIFLCGALCQRK